MEEKHIYEVNVEWKTERKGMMSSPGGLQDLEVATPPEFPKGHPGIWSPEHLYVASANSCLMTTFLAIAENSKLEYKSFSCKGTGTLEKVDGKFMISKIDLEAIVEISDEKDEKKALRVLEKSEAACLISNSMKTEVHLKPVIKVV
ncbi:MAG: OsmC family protein [Leptospiraceae bacterium]|nr:OsmC family protein [Leptospiraceae bacterium]